jgi:hypothetical protein
MNLKEIMACAKESPAAAFASNLFVVAIAKAPSKAKMHANVTVIDMRRDTHIPHLFVWLVCLANVLLASCSFAYFSTI